MLNNKFYDVFDILMYKYINNDDYNTINPREVEIIKSDYV